MTDINATYLAPFDRAKIFFLVGFMGSGKTHWGKIWADANQFSFVDLDELIEKKAGKTVADIFDSQGEGHFRVLEAEALRTCAKMKNTIIACGGGTPCFNNNMRWMNDHGVTIYINCTSQEILQRVLSEKEKRPLIKKINPAELLFFIEQKVKERELFYMRATLTLQSNLLTENFFAGILATSTT
ncbi:MAG: shikimate kinase [Ferruginibacter sp.]